MIQPTDENKFFDPAVLENALRALFAEALNPAVEIAPMRFHPMSIDAMIANDMIEFERVDDMMIPTVLGAAIIADFHEPMILDRDELAKSALIQRGYWPADEAPEAPACDCPPGQCFGARPDDADEPETIEGEVFEPYEIPYGPTVDAEWTPVATPTKREILADIASGFAAFGEAANSLLAQVDLLGDDE